MMCIRSLVLSLSMLAGFVVTLAAASAEAPAGPSLYDLELSFRNDLDQAVPFSHWKGSYVVTTMVYLRCKASCPLTIAKLKSIEKSLASENKQVEFVLTSFDSESDTPKDLAAFKEGHGLNEHWHLLTGTKESVRSLSFLLGFSYQKVDGSEEFNHSNRILLLGPDGVVLKSLDRLNADHGELVSLVPAIK
ncbi:MAG: SCO family protein [Oligoflexia bacterium]|nr:SCO family protein [Oligoflexia bacterium]